MLQNLIPSFPWIAPGLRAGWGTNFAIWQPWLGLHCEKKRKHARGKEVSGKDSQHWMNHEHIWDLWLQGENLLPSQVGGENAEIHSDLRKLWVITIMVELKKISWHYQVQICQNEANAHGGKLTQDSVQLHPLSKSQTVKKLGPRLPTLAFAADAAMILNHAT